MLATGMGQTCAVLDDATLKCWGRNEYGQLGLGDTEARGDEPGELGDALPTVNLGSNSTVRAVSAGVLHTCAVLESGAVKCWGTNSLLTGQLGLGDLDRRGDEPGEMGDALPPVELGTGRGASALAAGGEHTCVLLDDDAMKCWGHNAAGQLGVGDIEARGDERGEMGEALPFVNLGTGRRPTAIGAGGAHTCVLFDDAAVKCWGSNWHGQLGLGDNENRGKEPGEIGDALLPLEL